MNVRILGIILGQNKDYIILFQAKVLIWVRNNVFDLFAFFFVRWSALLVQGFLLSEYFGTLGPIFRKPCAPNSLQFIINHQKLWSIIFITHRLFSDIFTLTGLV